MLKRHSSRRKPLDASFLTNRLTGAKFYDRIAGYFSSSILEVAGEALESVEGKVRAVCNSSLSRADVEVAKAGQAAIRREWCDSRPEDLGDAAKPRFKRLSDFLRSGKIEIRVLPDEIFGLIHGKAGVITLADGRQTSFLGSANESKTAFRLNYELIWEDDSTEAVAWVQEEFNALWSSPFAVGLADFVVQDLDRLSRRELVRNISDWREEPDPAPVVVESPVYRTEVGLWEHQKHFVKLAFDAHRGTHGARFVLADQVGLGKTLQLAMAAQLMALIGDRPVLVLAPKPLLQQWQDELDTLLGLPSAIWDGGQWVDEQGVEHPGTGDEAIRRCPRRVGIVSTGLITRGGDAVELLANMRFECVVLDEAHRARRRNFRMNQPWASAKPNNLLHFLQRISPRTKSLLLATATPVQLHPIEAYDLLDALARGSEAVLGAPGSRWRRPQGSLDMLLGKASPPVDFHERWEWIRNPLPPRTEDKDFEMLRRSLSLSDDDAYAPGRAVEALRPPDRQRIENGFERFIERHNPYIRTIVRRTREYLESTVDPGTGEPYLAPVRIRLHGESDDDAIKLPPFLEDAYALAEDFCKLLGERSNTGFFRTMLLRRLGSTIEAGLLTVTRILNGWEALDDDDHDDEEKDDRLGTLTNEERQVLSRLAQAMEANRHQDPKAAAVTRLLVDDGWLERGCIVFSQYYDSVWWLANQLTRELPDETIGIYAGVNRSGAMRGGIFERRNRDALKDAVRRDELRLLLGTDAASEGLNLQRLGTLINLDLPWNPSRLEQRKGRIQRIGQVRPEVDVYNLRYAGSVEDRVHQLLSQRLQDISGLFGQLPDTLEDVWIQVALGQLEEARKTIDMVPEKHPFEIRYHEVKPVDWESCAQVLDDDARRQSLAQGWKS
ncbi:MAG: phospholipase D-like domain-containing protein [Deltaproteobacteria bacterium]|nr:phospholipase D-like domain-containing protein [Deltaproteobacteria bacterium]